MGRLRRMIGGWVRVTLCGYAPERFLNLCRARQMTIWDLECKGDHYVFSMGLSDYRNTRPLARKARVRLRSSSRCGLPFFVRRNRARWVFAAGFCTFFALLWAMSLFVWGIEISGNLQYTDDTMLRNLDTWNVRPGTRKRAIDCESLESSIRAAFPQITWVSVRLEGTRLVIQIKENDVGGEDLEKPRDPANLIAAKSGVITSMIVRAGTPLVRIGDAVEAGQMLVSANISIKNDGGEEIGTHQVFADADVWARTQNSYTKTFPLLHREKSYSGRKRYGIRIRAGEHIFPLLLPTLQKTSWEYLVTERQIHLGADFYLPIFCDWVVGREVSVYERNYTQDKLSRLAETERARFCENLEQKGVQILEIDDRIEVSAKTCTLSGQAVTIERIEQSVPNMESEE